MIIVLLWLLQVDFKQRCHHPLHRPRGHPLQVHPLHQRLEGQREEEQSRVVNHPPEGLSWTPFIKGQSWRKLWPMIEVHLLHVSYSVVPL